MTRLSPSTAICPTKVGRPFGQPATREPSPAVSALRASVRRSFQRLSRPLHIGDMNQTGEAGATNLPNPFPPARQVIGGIAFVLLIIFAFGSVA